MEIKDIQRYGMYLLLLIFFAYGLNGEFIERHLFFNEILSFAGCIFFLTFTFQFEKKYLVYIPSSKIYRLVLFYLALCVFHMAFSLIYKTNLYFYLRNTVIFYSAFVFFLMFHLEPYVSKFTRTIKLPLFSFVAIGLLIPKYNLLDRFNAAVIFPFFFNAFKWYHITLLLALNLILAIQYSSMTVTVVSVLLLGIIMIPKFKWFKALTIVGLVTLVLFFVGFNSNIKQYDQGHYRLFGDTYGVINSHEIFSKDLNSTWRVVFWHRAAIERFPENLVGIGFGTPLLKYDKGSNTVETDHDDFHDIHVSGTHNTYITLTLRLGLLYLVLMTLIFGEVFKHFYARKKEILKSNIGTYFMAFFTISLIGLFNLVKESPLSAALFWGLLGLVAASMYKQESSS